MGEQLPSFLGDAERKAAFDRELDAQLRKIDEAERKAKSASPAIGCGIIGAALLGAAFWASGVMENFKEPKPKTLTPEQQQALEESERKIGRMLSPLVFGSIGIQTNEFDIPEDPFKDTAVILPPEERRQMIEKINAERKRQEQPAQAQIPAKEPAQTKDFRERR